MKSLFLGAIFLYILLLWAIGWIASNARRGLKVIWWPTEVFHAIGVGPGRWHLDWWCFRCRNGSGSVPPWPLSHLLSARYLGGHVFHSGISSEVIVGRRLIPFSTS